MRFLPSIGIAGFGLLALFACQANPPDDHTHAISFEDRVVLQSSLHKPRQSLSVLNLGPGPVEVFLGTESAHSHPIELQEGAREYVMLGEPRTVEIRHPAGGTAKIEWSIDPDLHDRIRVEIDDPAHTSDPKH